MMKLINIHAYNSTSLSIEDREKYIIPEEYNGRVVLETWNINGNIRYKGVALNSGIRNYLLSLGEFKPDKKVEVKPDIQLNYMRKKRLNSMWNKFNIIYQKAMQNIEGADDEDILRLELEIIGHDVNIKSAVVNTPDDWFEEVFGSTKEDKHQEEIEQYKGMLDKYKKHFIDGSTNNSIFCNSELKNNIQTRGEELKSLFDVTLDVMSGSTRDGITKSTISDMIKLQEKMEEYNKKYPSKTNNPTNMLKQTSDIIQKMKNE